MRETKGLDRVASLTYVRAKARGLAQQSISRHERNENSETECHEYRLCGKAGEKSVGWRKIILGPDLLHRGFGVFFATETFKIAAIQGSSRATIFEKHHFASDVDGELRSFQDNGTPSLDSWSNFSARCRSLFAVTASLLISLDASLAANSPSDCFSARAD